MPSSSRISVSASAQISSSRCQSVLLRARRETSSPITIPGPPQTDLGDQLLETFAVAGRGRRLAEVAVDDDHLLMVPTQRGRTLLQGVLTLGALGVLEDLAHDDWRTYR